jgi:two-component system, LuxR family, sensor kinase FixL
MSWVTIIWSMTASACLTLALVHVLIWCRQWKARANLAFALTAVAVAAFAACELWMMRSATPGEMACALKWIQVPAWVLIISLVFFVRSYLRAGRAWLAWTIVGLRTFALVLNFLTGQNINYREVTQLQHIRFLGETVSTPDGAVNPWMLVAQLSLWLLIFFYAGRLDQCLAKGRPTAGIMGGRLHPSF